ncbi:siphovirus Gp157 family protein [Weissella minor]|uniref:siphovirus Gp157 family protein n=1 Tax=Weissella minor TaxID=1620 RepID=UPI003AF202CE
MKTLYELTAAYEEVFNRDDLDDETYIDTLEAIDTTIYEKADNYAKMIAQFEAENDAIKAQADRLTQRKKSNTNRIKAMKAALKESMERTDNKKINTELFSFGIQKNPPHVKGGISIDDVPKKYVKTKTETVIDKKEIIDEWKKSNGEQFANLIEQGERLNIK